MPGRKGEGVVEGPAGGEGAKLPGRAKRYYEKGRIDIISRWGRNRRR